MEKKDSMQGVYSQSTQSFQRNSQEMEENSGYTANTANKKIVQQSNRLYSR